jgi:hypothetical protein
VGVTLGATDGPSVEGAIPVLQANEAREKSERAERARRAERFMLVDCRPPPDSVDPSFDFQSFD